MLFDSVPMITRSSNCARRRLSASSAPPRSTRRRASVRASTPGSQRHLLDSRTAPARHARRSSSTQRGIEHVGACRDEDDALARLEAAIVETGAAMAAEVDEDDARRLRLLEHRPRTRLAPTPTNRRNRDGEERARLALTRGNGAASRVLPARASRPAMRPGGPCRRRANFVVLQDVFVDAGDVVERHAAFFCVSISR